MCLWAGGMPSTQRSKRPSRTMHDPMAFSARRKQAQYGTVKGAKKLEACRWAVQVGGFAQKVWVARPAHKWARSEANWEPRCVHGQMVCQAKRWAIWKQSKSECGCQPVACFCQSPTHKYLHYILLYIYMYYDNNNQANRTHTRTHTLTQWGTPFHQTDKPATPTDYILIDRYFFVLMLNARVWWVKQSMLDRHVSMEFWLRFN